MFVVKVVNNPMLHWGTHLQHEHEHSLHASSYLMRLNHRTLKN